MATQATELGLVKLPLENLGDELWLVSNPEETAEAFELGCQNNSDSPLDDAARVSRDVVVLATHWGNDIPGEPDEKWLTDLLNRVRPSDRAAVRDLVRDHWER